jgi:dihydrolipoamide dehydrogenase
MKKIIIIGSGPGGYHTAIILAKAGLDVTVIDKFLIGGTCLNVGCIPTKTLLDQTSALEHFRELFFKKKIFSSPENISNLNINIDNLRGFQGEIIQQLQMGLTKLFTKNKITLIKGKAKLVGNKKVEIETEEGIKTLDTDEIIIATGSRPKNIPSFEVDGKFVLNSDQVWNIPVIPKNLLVVGSGPIGIEFARVFNALGSKVTISEIQETICPILDKEISENLARSLKRRGIILKPNFATKLIEKKEDHADIQFISTKESVKETQEFDQVLVAVGRVPNVENIGLEEVGIELERNTFIKVNEYLQTNINNIWAIGDVTNFPQLAHTASFQARTVAKNILGKKYVFKGDLIPSCIFGYPEVAFVGKNEEQLKEENIDYKAGKFLYLASGKAKAASHTEGLVKVLMDKNTKKILGCHIIGAEASSIIHEIVIAMQNDITVDKLTESIHAHPTYSEVLLEALEDCLGEAIHS